MAQHQRKLPSDLKRKLIDEAGDKCANPGCSNWRVHIHHIQHWAVYKTHDSSHMIAICPSCHDATHHGKLRITDKALYEWKGVQRPKHSDSAHIYIEPARELKLLTGTLCLSTTNDQAVVFELSNTNHLKFRVLDKDILQVNVRLQDQNGHELLRVIENHVRVARDEHISFESRAGRAHITVPVTTDFAPSWLIDHMRSREQTFAEDGQIVALDIEVLKPGLLRVQGCWPDGDTGVVITENSLSLCRQDLQAPISLVGHGVDTVLKFTGPVTSAMFNFAK